MIRFECDERENKDELTLKDVEIDQFFIDVYGYFCQKLNNNRYSRIADSDGRPYSYTISDHTNGEKHTVYKVLPKVTKITWE